MVHRLSADSPVEVSRRTKYRPEPSPRGSHRIVPGPAANDSAARDAIRRPVTSCTCTDTSAGARSENASVRGPARQGFGDTTTPEKPATAGATPTVPGALAYRRVPDT